MKLARGWIFFTILILMLVAVPVYAEFDLDVGAAVLMDADTGQILFTQNEDVPLPPASITKIMTKLIIFEEIEAGRVSLDNIVRTSEYAASIGGSQVWLEPGEERTLEEMIIAISVGSANDASVAVAEYLSGTEAAFVRLMNQRAQQLGMEKTTFVNPHGLPAEEQRMSAYDIALMSREAVKHPGLLEYTGISHITFREGQRGELQLYNTNRLIGQYPGMDGLRTGYTTDAGYCLVATVERDGRRLISVVMGTDSQTKRYEETTKLLDYGFRAFYEYRVVNKGEVIQRAEVVDGVIREVDLIASDDLWVLTRRGSERDLIFEVEYRDGELRAPLDTTEIVGNLLVKDQDLLLGRVELRSGQDVARAGWFMRLLRRLLPF